MIPLEAWWNPMSWSAPFPVVWAALFCIVFLRAGATYLLGRLVARGGERTRAARFLERPGFAAGVEKINRWGAPAITLSFLTVGVQTMVNLAAGVLRMPLARYVPALAVGSVIWGFVYASVGFVGVKAVALAWDAHPALAIGVVAALAAAMGVFVWWNLRHPDNPDVA